MPTMTAQASNKPSNEALIGAEDGRQSLATPALVVDLDVLEQNLQLVAGHCRKSGVALRPHVKGHKCLELARRQLASGACGLACTTLVEAELMAESGASSLLITSPVIDSARTARLAALARAVPELVLTADDPAGLALLTRAAAIAGRPLQVLVDLDVGQRRTGIPAGSIDRILALAASIAATDGLGFAGVQAYYGHLQGVVAYAERARQARVQQVMVQAVINTLIRAGLAPPIVTGGGTGTLLIDTEHGPFTELQPGSYPFLDRQYGEVELTPDARPWLASSLFVRGRVVSVNQPDRVTIDVGMKAVSTDGGPAGLVRPDDITADYAVAGDEHAFLLLRQGSSRPALGETVELVPGHCDTTVSLHAQLHAVRGPVLEAIWPIDARGHW